MLPPCVRAHQVKFRPVLKQVTSINTRPVVSNANKVNLKFEEAKPVLEDQLAKSIANILDYLPRLV